MLHLMNAALVAAAAAAAAGSRALVIKIEVAIKF